MPPVTDRALLDDLIAKLREMEEQLSMARLEARPDSLLISRIRHLTILAAHVRMNLHKMRDELSAAPPSGEAARDQKSTL